MLRLSKSERARGVIKADAEDFKVEEITQNGIVLEIGKTYSHEDLGLAEEEGNFSVFVMQKKNWNTIQALKAIAKRFRRGVKSTGFAGTKDRTSVSTQLCSIFGVKPEQLLDMHIKDISINGAWNSASKIEMGKLLGNRFLIRIKEPSGYNSIDSILEELGGIFPNYFGEQRFGYRKNNRDIGIDILNGNFKGAAMKFLTDTHYETNEEANEARTRLYEERDFKAALNYFPQYLKYERTMIEYLSRFPTNYANAIRKLPRSLSLMFVHSVEAHIFNTELENMIKEGRTKPEKGSMTCGKDNYGFPDMSSIGKEENSKEFIVGNIIGYDTKELTDLEKLILEELNLTLDSFKAKGINELNSKGTYRVMFAPLKDISSNYKEEDNVYELGFSLPTGSYATVFMNEMIESD